MRFATPFCPVVLVLAMLVIAGCSSEPTRPGGPSTQFKGNVMGTPGIGTIVITVATSTTPPLPAAGVASATVPANATVRVSSGFEVIYLRGTYDTSTHELVLVASGWRLDGTLSGGVLRGNITVTGGSGAFIAQEQGAGADAVTTFCGVAGVGSCGSAGLGIRGASVAGVVQQLPFPYTLTLITFIGSFSATDSSLVLVDPASPTGPPLGTGRLWTNPHTTWAVVRFVFTPGDTCVWSGYLCQ